MKACGFRAPDAATGARSIRTRKRSQALLIPFEKLKCSLKIIGTFPDPVDLVDVFRAPDQISPIVDICIQRNIPVLWLQDGVFNEDEALRAQAAGITVIMNRCTYRDYMSLLK